MRVVVQGANKAQVTIDNEVVGKIKRGFLLLVRLREGDELDQVKKVADKIVKTHILGDEDGKTNLPLKDVNGEILNVSQFTLLTNTKKGSCSNFVEVMRPPKSKDLWENFNKELENRGFHAETGELGADMQVSPENGGPFIIVLDI